MNQIVPATIPTSFEHLNDTLRGIKPFSHEVQVDIVDGVFVPFTSWPYTEKDNIEKLKEFTQEFLIEIDLMVENPEDVVEEYLKAGVRRIVIHLESTKNLKSIVELKEGHDFKLGFSINNDTPLEVLTAHSRSFDYVQLMGIGKIGSQGQPFDVRVLTRIREIKKLYPTLLVSIDGSVNEETVTSLMKAGADRCVVGSAILKQPNPEYAYHSLTKLARAAHMQDSQV